MINTYSSLHNHDDYSNALLGFPDSINKTETIIQYAYDIGLNAVSITNHEGISSYIKAEKYFNKMQKDRPFKLILGNEIYLITEEENIINSDYTSENKTPFYHFLLNALDSKGNEMIRQLSTLAWNRSYYYKGLKRRPTFHSDLQNIITEQGHLVASTACAGGRLPKLILQWKEQGDIVKRLIHEFITFNIQVFGKEFFYLEIQPCKPDNEEQIYINEKLIFLAQAYKLKCIITTDSHYLKQEDSIIHTAYLNHKDGGDARETDKFYATTYMMSPEELRNMLHLQFNDEQIDVLFANTNEIAEKVQEYSLHHVSDIPVIPENKLPQFTITHCFKQYYDEFTNIARCALSQDIYARFLWYKLEEGVLKRIPKEKYYEYLKRLDFECGEVWQVGQILNTSMESYFTTVQQIIDIIWSEGDSLVGCGRGSCGAFLINYVLGINQIDPVPLGDLFPSWRFMSAGRSASLMDIDIDIESSKKEQILSAVKQFWGEEHVLQCATFAQISPKTAILKGGKGLGYNDEDMSYLASLIPNVRGEMYSLEDCLYGNEKKEIKPTTAFINELSKYPNLKETILGLQGIVTQMGIHAGAVNIMNKPLTATTACMTAPNGNRVSAFDLHDEEYTGTVKFDLLSIDALQKIRATLNYLLKYEKIQWQENLRSTYEFYLSPQIIDIVNPEMWKLLPTVYSCFQWDSPVGVMGINKINPQNIMELTTGNSLIRLQSRDGVSPLEMYVRYKNDINEWYSDMKDYGLNKEEQSIMKEYLLPSYGVMENQELCMRVSMDKRISGFSLAEADKLRKTIAKADKQALKETEEKFYSNGIANGCRRVFLDYIWKVQIYLSLSYSFSVIHAYEYSMIAIQELNLNYKFNPVYWNCACLSTEGQTDENSTGNTDYGKIAKSIYKMKKYGVNVLPPSINKSEISFTPIEENNTILFGLGGIAGINQDIAREIIAHRPYTSFKQFYDTFKEKEKTDTLIKPSKIIALIKAGCFDEFNTNRIALMRWFFAYENPQKVSLTMANMDKLIELGVSLPADIIKAYKFKSYVLNKDFLYCNDPNFKSKKHYIVEPKFARPYFEQKYMPTLTENIDYYFDDDKLIVIDKSLEKAMKNELESIKEVLNDKQVVDEYNKLLLRSIYQNTIGSDNINAWAIDTVCFYPNDGHELKNIDYEKYNLSHFYDLPEEPEFEVKQRGNRTWRQYKLSRICGTVIDRNDKDHLVDLLTPDNEVATLNIPQGQYGFYKKIVSEIIDGKKTVYDTSYFTRGQLLLVSGYRRGEAFFVRKYVNSIFQHSIIRVTEINPDGTLQLQLERPMIEE